MKVKLRLSLNERTILSLLTVLMISLNLGAQELLAGSAKRLLTPDPLLPVSGGVGAPKPADTRQGDLFARVLVLVKGGEKVAIVSVDNLGWPAALGDKSRKLIKDIPAKNILIGATHTHSAPDAYAFPDAEGKNAADLEYLEWCAGQIAQAVNEAQSKLQPAHLKIAIGEAKGKIAYNYYAPELYDPRCGVIQAIGTAGEAKGKVIATLVNYAIHPEVIGNKRGILSPDLVGPLNERIENRTGGMALFMNGAQGGMVTADNRLENGKEANDWRECQRIGYLLADEALRIVADAPIQKNAGLYCTHKEVEFPIESEMMRFILQHSPLGMGSEDGKSVVATVNLVNLGTAQILTIPGEALPNIGYYLKRNMPTPHPFLFGLTNDAFGYILTKEDFDSFDRYKYVSRTSLGEMTGEIFIKEALDLIEKSPKPQK
ncbi:hypothetical protein [Pseudozobellia thermophila]|uniref:Neutral/alkaline non-lysosomal ceramidase, N-terminal n=1 Tax=Pseudozobellia thermophila TaxID=192903 RepID=A0A1M6I594_9FLAO|nr:hypothetical protein [Pseudozobellia thermophila]SHJ29646.1 hypothetical protein SAMN04488513_103335 [Pseudozobellia thermophila]